MRPSIDHSLLSPNGRVSAKARAHAIVREAARLFPAGYWDAAPVSLEDALRTERERDLAQARQLRDLANRGMSPRKHNAAAAKLEAKWG